MKISNAIAVGMGAAFLFACSGSADTGSDGELTCGSCGNVCSAMQTCTNGMCH